MNNPTFKELLPFLYREGKDRFIKIVWTNESDCNKGYALGFVSGIIVGFVLSPIFAPMLAHNMLQDASDGIVVFIAILLSVLIVGFGGLVGLGIGRPTYLIVKWCNTLYENSLISWRTRNDNSN